MALALVLAACGGGSSGGGTGASGDKTAVKGGVLNMLGAGDVTYLDPNVSYYSLDYMAERMYTRQPYTNPAIEGQSTKPVADLAEGDPVVTDSGKTVTIKLRTGVQWNSTPPRDVVGEDLVRGLKYACNPAQPFGGLPDFIDLFVGYKAFCDGFAKVGQTAAAMAAYANSHQVEGIQQGANAQEVVFKLTHPASYLKDMMTLVTFSPRPKEYDAYVPASLELYQHLLSIGPYKIESYVPTKSLTYVRNDVWKADTDPVRKAYVDKIVVNQTLTQESVQQQLETGTPTADTQWDVHTPASQIPGLLAKKDPNLVFGETSSSNPYVVFNNVSPNNGGAMQKVEFRKALMQAINRDNLIQDLGGPSLNTALTQVLPSNIVGGEQKIDLYKYDPEAAKKAIAGLGLQNVTLKLLYRNANEGSRKEFATMQQDLAKAGINLVGVPSPNADFYSKYLQVPDVAKRGVWDLSTAGWGSDWYGNAALSYMGPLWSGQAAFPPIGSNFGFYENPKTNDLITQATLAQNLDQAKNLWHQADQQIMQDAAFFPITNPKGTVYHATQVHNCFYMDVFQMCDPTNVWLDKNTQGG
ncbi:MAG TPA: ABC transporter substrate-binding protein [Actinomycetes bacterium]